MKCDIVRERVKNSIELRVAKVLADLGHPQPPLDLNMVRALLQLDLNYFQKDESGLLQKLVHRCKVAGTQILRRPTLIADVVKNLDLRALLIPDRKMILIDEAQPIPKHRWLEAHEMGHKICDWHGDFLFGDNDHTLSPECHAKIEAEANYAAGQLLFLGERFRTHALDSAIGFKSVKELKETYANTITTTMWRYVEQVGATTPMLGVISCHPHVSRRPINFDPSTPCRHFIPSPAFAMRFSTTSESEVFTKIASYCGPQRGGPLGHDEIVLADDSGNVHLFQFETFFNQHDALTLGWHLREIPKQFAVHPAHTI
jgi:hypothetical protein